MKNRRKIPFSKQFNKCKLQLFRYKNYLVSGLIIILFLLACSILILHTTAHISKVKIFSNLKSENPTTTFSKILKKSVILTKIASPSPTLIPTVQPQNLGYCLNVPVLMYHHVEPWSQAVSLGHTSLAVDSVVFDEQMSYLSSHGYNTVFADDLVNALIGHSTLPANTVVVTLDDGYQDVYDYAYSTAKKYNVKLNVMVPTGLLGVSSGTNTYYTWNELKEMVGSGLVRAYNHTWSHYPLASGDSTKDQYEIMTAQNQLSQNLGSVSPIMAYPYGSGAGDQLVYDILQKDGFTAAFSTLAGTYQCTSYMYALRRTRIGSSPFPAFGIN